jgi:eukaryotic-like serine/threonine-protein kinase
MGRRSGVTDLERCPQCGTSLPPGIRPEACPQCLLALGFLWAGDDEPTVAAPAEASPEHLGRIGPYRFLTVLGEGGMGTVYLAEQREPIQRRVALKVIKRGMDTREVIARFESERQALALMGHPGIARVFDAGTTGDGLPYFVMEHVSGVWITEYCDQNRLSAEERLRLFVEVCEAVQHAHQKGIIHRDIKPSNVLVTVEEGKPRPKVIDFGVAKAIGQRLTEKTLFTERGVMVGTPGYMSPEQAQMTDLDVDTRTDVYSLGVLLYELLVGTVPFDPKRLREAGWAEMQRIVREEEPVKPSTKVSTLGEAATTVAEKRHTDPGALRRALRGDLDWITLKALEKDRTRRYGTAAEFAADIGRYLAHEPVAASPPSAAYRFQKLVRRHRAVFASAAVVLAALVVGLIATAVQYRRAETARKENRRQLVRVNVADGMRLAQQRDFFGALPRLAEALALEEESEQKLHRLRIGTVLDQMPRLVQVFPGAEYGGEFSQDGRRILTCDAKGVFRLWNRDTAEPESPPIDLGERFRSGVLSPDARRILATYDEEATLVDVSTGTPVGSPMRHGSPMRTAHYSPDGRRIVTAGEDGTVRIWDAETRSELCRTRHEGAVAEAMFRPDGKAVLSVSDTGTLIMTDEGCRPLFPAIRQEIGVESRSHWVRFSPDSRRFVSKARWTVRIWDADTGRPLTAPLRHGNPVESADFSPDAERLATAASDRSARIWDVKTGELVFPPITHDQPATDVTFSPDGAQLAIAWMDSVELVDSRTGRSEAGPVPCRACSAAFSPDGRFLLTSYGNANLWDLSGIENALVSIRHSQQVKYLDLRADRRLLATAVGVGVHPEGYARIWDPETGEPVGPPLRHAQMMSAAHLDPQAARILTSSLDGSVRMWDAKSGEPRTPPIPHPGAVLATAFNEDGRRFATFWSGKRVGSRPRQAGTGAVTIFETSSARALASRDLSRDAFCRQCLASVRGGSLVAADGDPLILDWATGLPTAPPLAHGEPLAVLLASPDGRRVLTASATARIWDIGTGRPVFGSIEVGEFVMWASFDREGARLALGLVTGEVRVLKASSGEVISSPMQHGGMLYRALFSPDGRFLASAGLNGIVRLWDPATGTPVAMDLRHPDAVWDVAFSPDGMRIVTACQDGLARVFDLPVAEEPAEDLRELAGLLSGREIAPTEFFAPLSSDRLFASWQRLRGKHPDLFRVPPERVAAWHRRLGESLLAERRWKEAISHLDETLRGGPERATVLAERAEAKLQSADDAGAVRDFARAIELRPDDAELRGGLVRALLASGDASGARAECARMLERFGNTRNPDQARHTAQACANAGGLGSAAATRVVALARVALEIETENPERLDLLAVALRSAGDSEGAAEIERRAAALRKAS